MSALVPALLAGLAAGVLLMPPSSVARLDALRAPRASPRDGKERTEPAGLLSPRFLQVCAGVGGLGLALVVGGVPGVVLGLALGLGGPPVLGRLEPTAVRRRRERFAADLPLALDLLSACLAGGAALVPAVRVVADAVPGPCGHRLARVAAALDVGTPAGDAWSLLCESPDEELAASAARALSRAGEGGAPVGAAVRRLAAQARRQERGRGEQAAQRAGVLAVAPLGLCFLPAFVLIGIVPLVAGLVGPLLATF